MREHQYFSVLLGTGVLFCVDRVLKAFAYSHQQFERLIAPWLGWDYFGNPGIAFSLPFPNLLLIGGTPIIILLIVAFLSYKPNARNVAVGLILIAAGALSNWIDRLLYEITIDYIRVFQSVINIADVMIVIGAVIAVWGKSSPKKRQRDREDTHIPKPDF